MAILSEEIINDSIACIVIQKTTPHIFGVGCPFSTFRVGDVKGVKGARFCLNRCGKIFRKVVIEYEDFGHIECPCTLMNGSYVIRKFWKSIE